MNTSAIQDYLSSLDFKLLKFCQHAPVYLKREVTGSTVILSNTRLGLSKEFVIDFSVTVSDFIFEIHQFLKDNWYPTVLLPSATLVTLRSANIELVPDVLTEELTSGTLLIIDKMDLKKNRIVVIDAEDQTLPPQVYHVHMPVTMFLALIRKYEDDFDRSTFFQEKTQLLSLGDTNVQ